MLNLLWLGALGRKVFNANARLLGLLQWVRRLSLVFALGMWFLVFGVVRLLVFVRSIAQVAMVGSAGSQRYGSFLMRNHVCLVCCSEFED